MNQPVTQTSEFADSALDAFKFRGLGDWLIHGGCPFWLIIFLKHVAIIYKE
jgi:hypothetical protein